MDEQTPIAGVTRPARGTRPSNRRAIILTAARELIRERGYEHVSMGDIADEVSVGASALYRHFTSKQRLLLEVVEGAIVPIKAAVDGLDLRNREAGLLALADLVLDHSYLGALWAREVRHLALEQQDQIGAEVSAIAAEFAAKLGEIRPGLGAAARDLLAWSVLGVLLGPSFQHQQVSRDEHVVLLADMMSRVLDAAIPAECAATAQSASTVKGLIPASRREALLLQATRLFAQRRYAGVGIEDVAASLGIAGPSIYNYFSSKSELLAIALGRAAGHLYLQVDQALSTHDACVPALRELIRSYTDFAVTHPDLVAVLITEARNLGDPYREEAVQAQRDYVNEWAHLLTGTGGREIGLVEARLRVQAALTVVNTVTQVHHLRVAPGAASAVAAVAEAAIGLP